jgi:hypothetical protein
MGLSLAAPNVLITRGFSEARSTAEAKRQSVACGYNSIRALCKEITTLDELAKYASAVRIRWRPPLFCWRRVNP